MSSSKVLLSTLLISKLVARGMSRAAAKKLVEGSATSVAAASVSKNLSEKDRKRVKNLPDRKAVKKFLKGGKAVIKEKERRQRDKDFLKEENKRARQAEAERLRKNAEEVRKFRELLKRAKSEKKEGFAEGIREKIRSRMEEISKIKGKRNPKK